MGVTLGLSYLGKNTGWGVFENGALVGVFGLRMKEGSGGDWRKSCTEKHQDL